MDLELGQTAVFVEHWALVTDHDSLSEEPVTTLWKEGYDDTDRIERYSVKTSVLHQMTGNHCEAEYQGLTGRTVLAKVKYSESVKKNQWYTEKELTPATEDISSYYKL